MFQSKFAKLIYLQQKLRWTTIETEMNSGICHKGNLADENWPRNDTIKQLIYLGNI